MAENNRNPRTESIKDSVMAEIVIEKLEKIDELLQKSEKIESMMNSLLVFNEEYLKEQKKYREQFEDFVNANALFLGNFRPIIDKTLNVCDLWADEIKKEKGLNYKLLSKIGDTIALFNRPILKHLKWLTFAFLLAIYTSIIILIIN